MQNWALSILPSLCSWVRQIVTSAHADGVVLGLSGGLDSSTSAALLVNALGNDRVTGVAMPCHSSSQDLEHARLVAERLNISLKVVDLSSTYDQFLLQLGTLSSLASVNIRPRLRMTTLYALAQQQNCLVCGNGNKDEWMTGYFTKHGDSACDFLPLLDLTKGQVRALARVLNVPSVIIEKPPSAGLWQGQTDENEMGVTYDHIDRWVHGEDVPADVRAKLERRLQVTEHKRHMPPYFQATKNFNEVK